MFQYYLGQIRMEMDFPPNLFLNQPTVDVRNRIYGKQHSRSADPFEYPSTITPKKYSFSFYSCLKFVLMLIFRHICYEIGRYTGLYQLNSVKFVLEPSL